MLTLANNRRQRQRLPFYLIVFILFYPSKTVCMYVLRSRCIDSQCQCQRRLSDMAIAVTDKIYTNLHALGSLANANAMLPSLPLETTVILFFAFSSPRKVHPLESRFRFQGSPC
ncbi:hypothetical protein LX32DRAFT_204451 [Colletotrichum zoysiae]|uniref:Uncharacterized protein n=1 Tax=Colletotrichum zoysiae TaxID=1216348 RepID=A0AAD9LXZ9_9PEZI|nr:hypothetical protein LX32DRAFT_204451 [Colletotrichum zoysiae]